MYELSRMVMTHTSFGTNGMIFVFSDGRKGNDCFFPRMGGKPGMFMVVNIVGYDRLTVCV